MKSMKIIKLVGLPRRISNPVQFPLSEQTKQQLKQLKTAFRNSFEEYQVYTLGLSAPQIGVWKQFCIMPQSFHFGRIKGFKKLKHIVRNFNTYINPRVIASSQQMVKMNEYCLSIDQNEYIISRPKFVDVEYYKQDGSMHRQKFDAFRSRIIQHQIDHFNGILMSEIEGAQIAGAYRDNSRS